MNQYHWDLEDPVMDYISHHGILGQKWGVRRYQNSDGTLTAEGRNRIKSGDTEVVEKIGRERANTLYKNMSESDIKRRQDAYKDLRDKEDKMKEAPDKISREERKKIHDDLTKASEKLEKIRKSDFKKIYKDIDTDDYYVKRALDSAMSKVSDKYIYKPVNKQRNASKIMKNVQKGISDFASQIPAQMVYDATADEVAKILASML